MIGGISIISLGGWFFPKIGSVAGARHWFKGPKKTIEEAEFRNARIEGDED